MIGSNEEIEEVFYDAPHTFSSYSMSLQDSLQETCLALKLFLNNKFNLAREILKPYILESIYHSLGYSTLLYLQAFMTFDSCDIESATESLRISLEVCQKFRHKKSFTATWGIKKNDYNKYSIEEVHAELCYAECILEKAMLTFIQDESLISFVKGGIKIRTSYYCYKECQEILENYGWSDGDNFCTKTHFESGTRMGIGGFNLILANLPARILKLLEFIGFSGNKEIGLKELERGTFQDRYSLRSPLCAITLLVYYLFTVYVLGSGKCNPGMCQRILNLMMKDHPNGAIFLYFQARLYEVLGHFPKAIDAFNFTINCQNEFKQIQYLCYWELMWCYAYDSDWLKAAQYCKMLAAGSKWSKSTYLYHQASCLLMVNWNTHENGDESSKKLTKTQIVKLLTEAPLHKQRLAGKSIPIEKFVVKKCQRFVDQNNYLIVPAYELIYLWNGFSILRKRQDYIEAMLNRLTFEEKALTKHAKDPFYNDNICLVKLLQGMCYKCLKEIEASALAFEFILFHELRDDTYLIPYAMVEIAFLLIDAGEYLSAIPYLDTARSCNGYTLQSRLHFKIHTACKFIEAQGINPLAPLNTWSGVLSAASPIANYLVSSLPKGTTSIFTNPNTTNLGVSSTLNSTTNNKNINDNNNNFNTVKKSTSSNGLSAQELSVILHHTSLFKKNNDPKTPNKIDDNHLPVIGDKNVPQINKKLPFCIITSPPKIKNGNSRRKLSGGDILLEQTNTSPNKRKHLVANRNNLYPSTNLNSNQLMINGNGYQDSLYGINGESEDLNSPPKSGPPILDSNLESVFFAQKVQNLNSSPSNIPTQTNEEMAFSVKKQEPLVSAKKGKHHQHFKKFEKFLKLNKSQSNKLQTPLTSSLSLFYEPSSTLSHAENGNNDKITHLHNVNPSIQKQKTEYDRSQYSPHPRGLNDNDSIMSENISPKSYSHANAATNKKYDSFFKRGDQFWASVRGINLKSNDSNSTHSRLNSHDLKHQINKKLGKSKKTQSSDANISFNSHKSTINTTHQFMTVIPKAVKFAKKIGKHKLYSKNISEHPTTSLNDSPLLHVMDGSLNGHNNMPSTGPLQQSTPKSKHSYLDQKILHERLPDDNQERTLDSSLLK